MYYCYSVIIDQGTSVPGNGKEVVDLLNAVENYYIYKLMSNVQLTGSTRFDSHMQMNTGNQKNDVILAKKFQQHLKQENSQK